MSISRYDVAPEQPVINKYAPLPFEDIMNSLHYRQYEYDQNKQQDQDNQDNFLKVKALDPDVEKRNQILAGYQQDMKNAVDNAKGDYGSLGGFVDSQTRKIRSDLAYGHLGAIHNNALAFDEHNKELDKLGLTPETKLGILDASIGNFAQQGGTQHLGGGKYSRYNGIQGTKEGVAQENAMKVAKEVLPHKLATAGYSQDQHGFYKIVGTTKEYLPASEISDIVDKYTRLNPESMADLHQQYLVQHHRTNDFNPQTQGELDNYTKLHQQYPNASPQELHHRNFIDQESKKISDNVASIYDKDDITHKSLSLVRDPVADHFAKKAMEQSSLSNIGTSNIEQVDNPNYKNALGDLSIEGDKVVTPSYYKSENGKKTPISKEEHDQLASIRAKASTQGYIPVGMPIESTERSKEVSYNDLYKNPDIKHVVDDEFEKQTGKRPNEVQKPSKEFIKNTLVDYKKAIDNNAKLNLDQHNNDSEQIVKNGKILNAQLQSSEIIPLDANAKSLAKQTGGTLDYQQLTEKGYEVKGVKSSGVVYGTGMKQSNGQEIPIADRAIITLKKGNETKEISVLLRTPENGIQNSHEAQVIQNIAKVKQSAHTGEISINPDLKAVVKYSYKGGVAQPHVIYTDKDNNPIPLDVLRKGGFTKTGANGKEVPINLDDLQSALEENINHGLQKVGYGHRSKTTSKETELETELQ